VSALFPTPSIGGHAWVIELPSPHLSSLDRSGRWERTSVFVHSQIEWLNLNLEVVSFRRDPEREGESPMGGH